MKTVNIPEIGEVQLQKHAKSRSIRISLSADGKVKVTLPKWAPYQAAIAFVKSKADWVVANQIIPEIIKDGTAIGKFHHLYFKYDPNVITISSRRKGSQLWVTYPNKYKWNDSAVQIVANKIAIKALREQAESMLPKRLRDLAEKHDFDFTSVSVRQLKARWGSCNSKKEITLNLFLMQLPWDLIDYVLLHELTHTKALHHGEEFWRIFEEALPGAKAKRRLLRDHKPQVNTK